MIFAKAQTISLSFRFLPLQGGGVSLFLILTLAFTPRIAFAACTGPSGNAGDITYSSTQGLMAYCNGSGWIAMGSTSSTTFGTLTTNNFCTATGSTSIQCTTTSTGSGNVVLSAAPTLTGTVTGVSSTWSTGVAIGTTTLSGALNVSGTVNIAGTVNGTSFVGSGASLTGIGTSALGGITGSAGSTTYLRGDGTWSTIASSMVYPGAGIPNSTGSAWGTSYSVTGTGNVVLSASPTLTGTVTLASQTSTGTTSFQLGSDYTTTGSQSDVAINTVSAIRYNGAGVATFYGIVAGAAGQVLVLHNASSSILTLANQSASEATAGNKIITGSGADLAMAAGSSIIMQYDNSASRWRVIGGSGGATPAGSTGQVQYNSGSNTLAASSNMTFLSANNQLVVGTGASTPVGQGTSGIVSGMYLDAIPQAVAVTPSGVSGVTSINTGATGQMAYYSGTNAISGSSNLYVSGANIALGTSSASYLLSLDGQAARTIGMQRDYTAATVGQSLTVNAGGAVSGGTNLNGGNLVLASGVSTGTGTSSIQFNTSPGVAASTTDNTIATAMTITGAGLVGIGTITPTSILGLYSSAPVLTFMNTGNSGANGVDFRNSANVAIGGFFGNAANGDTYISSYLASQALTVKNTTGNVGIGTASPSQLLQLHNGNLYFDTSNYVMWDTSGNWSIQSDDSTKLAFKTGGGERMRIDGSGNVGIGTTSPLLLFHIKAGTNQNLWMSSRASNPDLAFGNDAGSAYVTGSLNASPLIINATSGGSVGIGTTSPATLLQVGSAVSSGSDYITIDAAAAQQSAIQWMSAGSQKWVLYRPASSNDLRFYNPTVGDSMAIQQSNGYVGIANNSPSYRLDVAGSIRSSSGGYVFPDGTTQTTAAASSSVPSGEWCGAATAQCSGSTKYYSYSKACNGSTLSYSGSCVTGNYGLCCYLTAGTWSGCPSGYTAVGAVNAQMNFTTSSALSNSGFCVKN